MNYICTICGKSSGIKKSDKYCRNCGAYGSIQSTVSTRQAHAIAENSAMEPYEKRLRELEKRMVETGKQIDSLFWTLANANFYKDAGMCGCFKKKVAALSPQPIHDEINPAQQQLRESTEEDILHEPN